MTLTAEGWLQQAQPVLRKLRDSGRWTDTDEGKVLLVGWFDIVELSALISAASFNKGLEEVGK